jgi:hypothetical protein
MLLIFDLWPWHPSSPLGWNLFAVSALPILIAGEWVGEKIVDNPVSTAVDRSTHQSDLSWIRIVYLLTLILAFIGTAVFIAYLLGRSSRPI